MRTKISTKYEGDNAIVIKNLMSTREQPVNENLVFVLQRFQFLPLDVSMHKRKRIHAVLALESVFCIEKKKTQYHFCPP